MMIKINGKSSYRLSNLKKEPLSMSIHARKRKKRDGSVVVNLRKISRIVSKRYARERNKCNWTRQSGQRVM